MTELIKLRRKLEPEQKMYLDDVIRVFGFWDSPFFQKISQGLKDTVKKISHSDIFK